MPEINTELFTVETNITEEQLNNLKLELPKIDDFNTKGVTIKEIKQKLSKARSSIETALDKQDPRFDYLIIVCVILAIICVAQVIHKSLPCLVKIMVPLRKRTQSTVPLNQEKENAAEEETDLAAGTTSQGEGIVTEMKCFK